MWRGSAHPSWHAACPAWQRSIAHPSRHAACPARRRSIAHLWASSGWVEMPFPGGFSIYAEPRQAASLRAACAAKPQHVGWRGSCCQPKAVVVHDAHFVQPRTLRLLLALGTALPRGARGQWHSRDPRGNAGKPRSRQMLCCLVQVACAPFVHVRCPLTLLPT